MSDVELSNISPGLLSALLFIFLDIFLVALLDNALARVVCLLYYREIDHGRPIVVNSADIPGITSFLIGKRFSYVNVLAIISKLLLLGVVLAANISINGKESMTKSDMRSSTFGFNASDVFISAKPIVVESRIERSKSCLKLEKDKITYYHIRFNLNNENGKQNDNDNDTTKFQVNDSTIICMSPENVRHPKILITVKGCTRRNITANDGSSCFSITSNKGIRKSFQSLTAPKISPSTGQLSHDFWDYNIDEIKQIFPEYKDIRHFTCLFTIIGVRDNVRQTTPLDYVHCLLIVYDTSNNNEKETIVERWILDNNSGPEHEFVLLYPGIIFEGELNFGKLACERYLKKPFPFTDYVTMSGELIAQASEYLALSKKDMEFGRLETKDNVVVTAVDLYAIPLVSVAVFLVIMANVIVFIITRRDKRPRFNTIQGISSIVREEHYSTGRSEIIGAGPSAILGLNFSNDTMHFGPINDTPDGVDIVEGQEWT